MWLPFLFDGRYIFLPGPQKKARGPGRLRADGKIPSRGQFEGTGSVQDLLTSASESSLRILGEVSDITSGETQATRRKIGILPSKLFRLSSASPYFSMLYGWGHFTPALRCVNALWGKLLGMAVTKCIVLQVVESPASKKPAF
jgi:hypothetical protein